MTGNGGGGGGGGERTEILMSNIRFERFWSVFLFLLNKKCPMLTTLKPRFWENIFSGKCNENISNSPFFVNLSITKVN